MMTMVACETSQAEIVRLNLHERQKAKIRFYENRRRYYILKRRQLLLNKEVEV